MGSVRAASAVAVAIAVAAIAVSGGTESDPRTPAALPGLPPPFLGIAVVGSGGRTAAVDGYGNVVDLRAPGPVGEARVAVPAAQQAAGSVDPGTAIVARARIGGKWLPFWRADSVRQRYLPGTNVLRTVAQFGDRTVAVVRAVGGPGAVRADRRWLARSRPLAADAPRWAQRLYRRSLLVLRGLTDRRTGAVAAGARDGWAYVWPRDAGAVALAFAAAGHRADARRVALFLQRLDPGAAARFDGTGEPVPGRGAQGDATGWIAAATRAAAGSQTEAQLPATDRHRSPRRGGRERAPWRERADYHEGEPGDYLGNALASTVPRVPFPSLTRERHTGSVPSALRPFVTSSGLVRIAAEPASGWDSAAAWGVRPFSQPALFPTIRRTLLRIAATSGRFGIVPSQDWRGGEDPWTAPTAWVAWSLAALGERRAALGLIADLRRAATPLGLLPERVDARTGTPRSTTPLAWSHAFAILALRELWPGRAGD